MHKYLETEMQKVRRIEAFRFSNPNPEQVDALRAVQSAMNKAMIVANNNCPPNTYSRMGAQKMADAFRHFKDAINHGEVSPATAREPEGTQQEEPAKTESS